MPDRGTFRLGTIVDPATGKPGSDELVVGSSDLTTHGVIVGMTGSGKTGLAVVLLEETLLAGIPAVIIDPKGDMANLALTFPALEPASFQPWVDASQAQSEGITVAQLAEREATTWREGLAARGIGPERIQQLRNAADVTVYTPGSAAGVPLNMIGSLGAPGLSWETEAETLRDEIEGTVTSLLGLVGVTADPLSSREHVLLANLIENAWRAGRDLDLGALIGEIQSPPVRKLGVFEIDAFFPPPERTALALKLNALIASPAFTAWGEGAPLDPQTLLFTADGKPRAAIIYLAHLSDEERMFASTLVFSRLVTWMKGQPGTSDLRALAYMDEVAGYVPPTAVPPAKKPILTIFKQGRAFGLGLVLSTQNPVDLDYKAMANAGTWLVGRLQTENDKARVLEGLRSAAGETDVDALGSAIGSLQKRQFMLVSAKGGAPRIFGTRFAMSYLRGPLTKEEVQRLAQSSPLPAGVAPAPVAPPPALLGADETPVAPAVAGGVTVSYLDPAAAWASQVGATAGVTRLHAFLATRVALRYDDAAAGIDEVEEFEALYGPLDNGLDLDDETVVDFDDRDFGPTPPAGAGYVLPTARVAEAKFFTQAAKDVRARLVANRALEIFRNRQLKLISRPGESEEAFLQRCDEAGQVRADEEAVKLTKRLEAKKDRLEKALGLARRRVEELDTQTKSRQANELITGAGAVLGALFGGKRSARSITSAVGSVASKHGQSATSSARRDTAEAKVHQTTDDLAELEQEILDEVAAIDEKWRDVAKAVEPLAIRLEATDVRVTDVRLVWVPAD
jgi:Helicase HerA, central domain